MEPSIIPVEPDNDSLETPPYKKYLPAKGLVNNNKKGSLWKTQHKSKKLPPLLILNN